VGSIRLDFSGVARLSEAVAEPSFVIKVEGSGGLSFTSPDMEIAEVRRQGENWTVELRIQPDQESGSLEFPAA
jgi:hypothetical protein